MKNNYPGISTFHVLDRFSEYENLVEQRELTAEEKAEMQTLEEELTTRKNNGDEWLQDDVYVDTCCFDVNPATGYMYLNRHRAAQQNVY